ncbi:MAG TPA: non-homologous end-joining DNA ligase [Candidatus Baltobacteraceae bacterium]|jgi:bifunctional non-homologous end joining protein LigD|nr:non-homologous end-joining DNA ligase [Candidatus Baltobacteraceae bacterium]
MPAARRPGASQSAKERGSLQRYHAKRDFQETPEPRGAKSKKSKRLRFVIQKHRATRLHYDFRLEADGVLKSWAIPKGPSFDPADKRLAMHVEDHPMDYRTFEGIIPKGNYGAGEVIVWDEGTYELSEGDDPAAEIGKGKIKFIMHGKKMHGEFTLVRIKGRSGEGGDPWLLFKDKDEYVNPKYDIEKDNKSVKTGRTVESYAKDPKAPHWISGKKAAGAERSAAKKAATRAKRDPIPVIKTPMLATLVDEPFDDDEWLFEIKWDGYRAICTVHEDGTLSLVSRNGLDFLGKFPELEALKNAWTTLPIVVDGEIVSLDDEGRSSFQRLQESLTSKRSTGRTRSSSHSRLMYAAFDLLYADGKDLRKLPLDDRKEQLQQAIADTGIVLYSKHVVGHGCALFKQAEHRHLEGIIGKRRDSAYLERRTRDWVKIKAQLMQEFVIGGFTEPRGSRTGFGSLLLGLYDRGKLYYVGHAGTGFNTKLLQSMTRDLKKLERKTSPFANKVEANTKPHFVEPKMVAEIRFTEWTRDGLLRQPAFIGLRLDKAAKECVRERPIDTDEVA